MVHHSQIIQKNKTSHMNTINSNTLSYCSKWYRPCLPYKVGNRTGVHEAFGFRYQAAKACKSWKQISKWGSQADPEFILESHLWMMVFEGAQLCQLECLTGVTEECWLAACSSMCKENYSEENPKIQQGKKQKGLKLELSMNLHMSNSENSSSNIALQIPSSQHLLILQGNQKGKKCLRLLLKKAAVAYVTQNTKSPSLISTCKQTLQNVNNIPMLSITTLQTSNTFPLFHIIREERPECVTHWCSTCLECTRPWVWFPTTHIHTHTLGTHRKVTQIGGTFL